MSESNTSVETKASKSLFWRSAYKLLAGLLGVYLYWSFVTIGSQGNRITALETELAGAKRENQAQWNSLRKSSAEHTAMEKELEVTNRLFNMLLSRGRFDAKLDELFTPGAVAPSVASPTPKPEETPDLPMFRQQEILDYEQIAKPR